MCGIFGRFSPTAELGDRNELVAATNLLRHRGPDDGTYWTDQHYFFGHRRLSIIDLESGSQPMGSADGRYVVVFNGEIYNFVELRVELERLGARFTTHSDTEVLLHGYREFGTDLPRHLSGMFAFGIADRQEKTLFVARDPFGEKPLFLWEQGNSVTFGSELSALVSLSGQSREISGEALAGFLCLNYAPGSETLVRSIRRLLPGTARLYSKNGPKEWRYFELPARPEARLTEGSALEQLGPKLDAAVRIALRSDVPVGLFLSGGIDSSLVAESACRQGKLTEAYCLDFEEPGYSELAGAQHVADRLGLKLHSVRLSADNLSDVETLVSHADDPLADSSALPVYTLAGAASANYKVVITGDGGDEMFGGYLTYKATLLHQELICRLPRPLRAILAATSQHLPVSDGKVSTSYKLMRLLRAATLAPCEAHFSWNGTFLPSQAAALQTAPHPEVIRRMAERLGLGEHTTLLDLQKADVLEYLPNDILSKVDRMTMAHGLEARAPLLSPEVARFGLALPDNLKVGLTGHPKRLLRKLAEQRLGARVAYAKKQGFSIPIHRWLRGPLRAELEDLLSPPSLSHLGFLDATQVIAQKNRHLSGEKQIGWELWGLMVLVTWHRLRIQHPPRLVGSTADLREIRLPAFQP
ncbi:MAG: asparagine synthase (glutamine-hydrolyzing) [Polyangiaceae bacterium]|nr:asparagine synthase (glutamine-hydrolyzing) [Polyangiaceae bacterium]